LIDESNRVVSKDVKGWKSEVDFDGFDSISFPIENMFSFQRETPLIEFLANWKELLLSSKIGSDSTKWLQSFGSPSLEFTLLNPCQSLQVTDILNGSLPISPWCHYS